MSAPCCQTTGNVLIGGVSGVGKSTVLLFSAIVATLLCDALPVVWDYTSASSTGWPSIAQRAATALHKWFAGHAADADFDASGDFTIEAVRSAAHTVGAASVMLFGDELNKLYGETPEHAPGAEAVEANRDLANTAKLAGIMAVISGSAAQLDARAFKHGTWRVIANHSLNDSVFTLYDLHPMRNLTKLQVSGGGPRGWLSSVDGLRLVFYSGVL